MAGAEIPEGGVIIKGSNRHLTLRCHSQKDFYKIGGDLNPFPVDNLFTADARVTLQTMLLLFCFLLTLKSLQTVPVHWFVSQLTVKSLQTMPVRCLFSADGSHYRLCPLLVCFLPTVKSLYRQCPFVGLFSAEGKVSTDSVGSLFVLCRR